MLKPTRPWLVVFTQGFPALQRFAQERFLPSNPLSSSCLWLDEDDFRFDTMNARRLGVPNPLRIDPYAHHPVLSRYASLKPLGGSTDTARGRRRGRPRKAELHAANAEHLAEAAPRRSRGRPAGSTAAAAVTCGDASHYQVPICTASLSKPLYLYNMDQMQYSADFTVPTTVRPDGAGEGEEESFTSTPAGDAAHAAFDDPRAAPLHASAAAILPHAWVATDAIWSAELALASGVLELQRQFPNSAAPHCSYFKRPMMLSIRSRRTFSMKVQQSLHALFKKHSYQSVWWGTARQWREVQAIPRPGEHEHVIPISVSSKLVHISLIADAAAVLERSFISAKRRRLLYIHEDGDTAAMPLAAVTDTLPSASELSWAGGSTGHTPVFGDAYRPRSFYNLIRDDMRVNKWRLPLYVTARHAGLMGLTLRPDAVGFQPSNSLVVRVSCVQDFADPIVTDPGTAGSQDVGGRAIRPESDSREREATDHAGSSSSSAMHCADSLETPSRNSVGVAPLTPNRLHDKVEFWYHISQVHFPDSYLVPSAVLSAELENPGVPLAGATGQRLPFEALTYKHLLLDRPEVAAALLPAAMHNSTDAPPAADAGTALNSSVASGVPVDSGADKAAGEADTSSSSSSSASAGSAAAADADEVAVACFVATHASPAHKQGRSLWYRAGEVLAAGGIVEVNSAPVEVRVPASTVQLSGKDSGFLMCGLGEIWPSDALRGAWFNVECLTNPDEALRFLSAPFEPR